MSDHSFQDMPLSRKQLVFLFMAAVIVAVSVFLLGVSFGRSVRPVSADASAGSATPIGSLDTMPPPTEPKPSDLTYHDALQGRPPASGAEAPPPAPPQPDARPPAATSNPPATTPPPAAPPPVASASPPVAAAPPPAPPATQPASASGRLYLQTEALGTAQAAQRAVDKLKGLTYPASMSRDPASGLYRVVVGPYASDSDRDRALARLQKDGYKPFRR